jgi:hypothetical protein
MTIVNKADLEMDLTLDLTGPDDNTFVLLGYAMRFSEQLDLDADEVLEEMKSGDYENLVKVFDHHFGKFVILLR